MSEPTRSSQWSRASLSITALLLTHFWTEPAAGQQAPAAPPAPAACLGYAYSTRPSFFLREGISTIEAVVPGSPAEAGGLRPEDVLFTVNGNRVGSASPTAVMAPGDTVRMVVLRGDRTVELTLVTGERVSPPGGERGGSRLQARAETGGVSSQVARSPLPTPHGVEPRSGSTLPLTLSAVLRTLP